MRSKPAALTSVTVLKGSDLRTHQADKIQKSLVHAVSPRISLQMRYPELAVALAACSGVLEPSRGVAAIGCGESPAGAPAPALLPRCRRNPANCAPASHLPPTCPDQAKQVPALRCLSLLPT